jgi:phage portal protein BeeE
MPYLIAYEEAINRDLLSEDERDTYFAKFNVSGFMRGDSEARANYYDKMLKNGVYSINEVRKFEEMNKINTLQTLMIAALHCLMLLYLGHRENARGRRKYRLQFLPFEIF